MSSLQVGLWIKYYVVSMYTVVQVRVYNIVYHLRTQPVNDHAGASAPAQVSSLVHYTHIQYCPPSAVGKLFT
jgi:hypothetical protein